MIDDVGTSFGHSPSAISTKTFQFTANGVDNVSMSLLGAPKRANLVNPVLYGFTISQVPEPSSALLVAAGLAFGGALALRYRRRFAE